jgi:hypothetical protein
MRVYKTPVVRRTTRASKPPFLLHVTGAEVVDASRASVILNLSPTPYVPKGGGR